MPNIEQRFRIAVVTGLDGMEESHFIEAFLQELNGSNRLAAAKGTRAKLGSRLKTKIIDCQWWRARQRGDPWDCGYLVEDPTARRRLSTFLPLRSTRLIAEEFDRIVD